MCIIVSTQVTQIFWFCSFFFSFSCWLFFLLVHLNKYQFGETHPNSQCCLRCCASARSTCLIISAVYHLQDTLTCRVHNCRTKSERQKWHFIVIYLFIILHISFDSTRTRQESYQERVVTYRGSENFRFSQVSDASSDFARLGFTRGNASRVSTLDFIYSFSELRQCQRLGLKSGSKLPMILMRFYQYQGATWSQTYKKWYGSSGCVHLCGHQGAVSWLFCLYIPMGGTHFNRFKYEKNILPLRYLITLGNLHSYKTYIRDKRLCDLFILKSNVIYTKLYVVPPADLQLLKGAYKSYFNMANIMNKANLAANIPTIMHWIEAPVYGLRGPTRMCYMVSRIFSMPEGVTCRHPAGALWG